MAPDWPSGHAVYDLILRRRLAGVDAAAAQDPQHIIAEAMTFESMGNLEEAMSAWIDLAVSALARAELLRTESLRGSSNSQPE